MHFIETKTSLRKLARHLRDFSLPQVPAASGVFRLLNATEPQFGKAIPISQARGLAGRREAKKPLLGAAVPDFADDWSRRVRHCR
jgi:hypothetical protein